LGKKAYKALMKENPNYKLSMEGEGSLLGVFACFIRTGNCHEFVLTLFILFTLASGGSIVLSSKGDVLFVHQEKVFGDVAKVNPLVVVDAYMIHQTSALIKSCSSLLFRCSCFLALNDKLRRAHSQMIFSKLVKQVHRVVCSF
jgi:hypothetical protein